MKVNLFSIRVSFAPRPYVMIIEIYTYDAQRHRINFRNFQQQQKKNFYLFVPRL